MVTQGGYTHSIRVSPHYMYLTQGFTLKVKLFDVNVFAVPVVPESENAQKIWEAIKPEVQATIEEYLDQEEIIDEEDGPVEFQGDLDTALEW